MKRGRDGGYTIVEVMIVLAVTGALFASAVLLLGGKQRKTEYQQGIRDYESKIQNVMSDVGASYYQNDRACAVSGPNEPTFPGGAPTPGANADCIFLGKAMLIGTSPAQTTDIVTVIGRHYAADGVTNIDDVPTAKPVIQPSATDTYVQTFGTEVVKIKDIASGTDLKGVGFYLETGTSAGVAASKSIHLYGLRGADPITDTATFGTGNYLPLPKGAIICLQGSDFFAEIVVGGGGSPTNITTTLETTGAGICA